jgi:ankyrin repeat protein
LRWHNVEERLTPMHRAPISSGNICSIGYDSGSKTLEIEFNDGAVTQFLNVPLSVYTALMEAESKTDYYQTSIAFNYAFRRIWRNLDELFLAIADVLVSEREQPINVHTRGFEEDTPLHVAAVWGDVAAIEMLVAAGAEIDALGDLDTTPLYNAVGQGHVQAARKLLELGASPHSSNLLNSTPALRAAASDIPDRIQTQTLSPDLQGGSCMGKSARSLTG